MAYSKQHYKNLIDDQLTKATAALALYESMHEGNKHPQESYLREIEQCLSKAKSHIHTLRHLRQLSD